MTTMRTNLLMADLHYRRQVSNVYYRSCHQPWERFLQVFLMVSMYEKIRFPFSQLRENSASVGKLSPTLFSIWLLPSTSLLLARLKFVTNRWHAAQARNSAFALISGI